MIAALSACAPDIDDNGEVVVAAGDESPEIGEVSQSLVGAWVPGEQFTSAGQEGQSWYWGETPSNFWTTLSQPNTEYSIQGTLRNTGSTRIVTNAAFWHINVASSANGCVLYGCDLTLCMENLSRGWGTCTAVLGQGTTSSNPDLHGYTTFFNGLAIGGGETVRWTLFLQTRAFLPWTIAIDHFDMWVTGGS
jgi:hypothetical protein